MTVSVSDRTVLTTCPRDCYDACGILVTVRDAGSEEVFHTFKLSVGE